MDLGHFSLARIISYTDLFSNFLEDCSCVLCCPGFVSRILVTLALGSWNMNYTSEVLDNVKNYIIVLLRYTNGVVDIDTNV